jgi:2-keto-3-deoxy-L-rhamnonate aldolase RhmA
MTVIRNAAKQRLASGELSLGMGVRQARTVDIATVARTTGYDWLFIDMEHNSMSMDTAAQIAHAALAVGVTPVVRVPGKEHYHASRMLDAGAMGVVVPHVDTAEEAARVVSHCKYPPVGHRSLGGPPPQLSYKPASVVDATRMVNEETLVVVMLETPLAIENADAIAAVPGLDVLLVGFNDLCAEMGIPGDYNAQKTQDAFSKVVAACKKHGKHPGMGGIYDHPTMQKYIGLGARFILSGSDFSFVMSGANARSAFLRGLKI